MPTLNRTVAARALVVLAAGAVLVAAAPWSSGGAQPAAAKPLNPYVSWSGRSSGIAQAPETLRIASAAEWEKTWDRHAGPGKGVAWRPDIDFDRCMVLAVFAGPVWNTSGERIASAEDLGDRIRIRIVGETYQTLGPDGGGERSTPFGIFVLPRSAKPLIVETDARELKNEPARWKALARFEALAPAAK